MSAPTKGWTTTTILDWDESRKFIWDQVKCGTHITIRDGESGDAFAVLVPLDDYKGET